MKSQLLFEAIQNIDLCKEAYLWPYLSKTKPILKTTLLLGELHKREGAVERTSVRQYEGPDNYSRNWRT